MSRSNCQVRRNKVSPINPENLVSLKEASLRLGEGFSRSSIYRRIESGEWVEGIHWIDDRRPSSLKRIIKINLAAIQELRRIPSSQR